MRWFYIFLLIALIYIFSYNKKEFTSEDLLKTDSKEIEKLYQLHGFIDSLFEREKIPYFAVAGTILGAVRHGGIIPWDDDLDIAVSSLDIPRIFELHEVLEKEGLSIAVFDGWIKIYYTDGKPIDGFEWKYPWIDLFLMESDNQGKVVYSIERMRDGFPNDWHYEDDVRDLKRLPFGKKTIPVPNQWVGYLNRMYGPNWNTVAYRDYDHSQEKKCEKIVVPITNFRTQ